MSIHEATHREPVRFVAESRVGRAAAEEEVADVGAISRTAPIAAVGPHTERTIAVDAVARHGQFQR